MENSPLERENQQLRKELDRLRKQLANCNESYNSAQALELAELIIDNSNAILFRRLAADDPQKRKMVYVSPNISRFGYQPEDFLSGRTMYRDLVFPEDSPRTLKEIQAFVERGIETYTQQYRIVTRQGEVRWVEDRTSVYKDSATGQRYHQGIVIDVHEKKAAEEKLRKSEEKHRRIIETASEGFILLDEAYRIIDLNTAYAMMVNRPREELVGRKPFELFSGDSPENWFYHKAGPGNIQSRELECELTRSDGQKMPVLIHASALRSDKEEILGTMAFVTDISTQKKALQLAAEVQKGLLPARAPTLPGLDIAGINLCCEEVGGDYFDYLSRPDEKNSLTVVIGDISGHGADSALLMSSARACLRVRGAQRGSPEDIVTSLNQHLVNDVGDSGRFMTLFYLAIEREHKSIRWIRAGHDPALLYDPAEDQFAELKGPGLALGVDQDYLYQVQYRGDVQPGQILALTTDGIWEACNGAGEMFGKERLKGAIKNKSDKCADAILAHILDEHARFTRGAALDDDITLVIIKIVEP